MKSIFDIYALYVPSNGSARGGGGVGTNAPLSGIPAPAPIGAKIQLSSGIIFPLLDFGRVGRMKFFGLGQVAGRVLHQVRQT